MKKMRYPRRRRLRLPLSQMLERDKLIYRFLGERQIPYAGLMSGGYGPDVWEVYTRISFVGASGSSAVRSAWIVTPMKIKKAITTS